MPRMSSSRVRVRLFMTTPPRRSLKRSLELKLGTKLEAKLETKLGTEALNKVANCPDIGGTVTIFVSLSRVPPSAMTVPTFRNDWRSNWIRLYLELMSQRVRVRVSWPIIKYACAHYALSTSTSI